MRRRGRERPVGPRAAGPASAQHELARLGRDQVHHRPGAPTVACRHCGEPLVWVPDVGWVVDEPAGSYDLCEADPLGLHDPLQDIGT